MPGARSDDRSSFGQYFAVREVLDEQCVVQNTAVDPIPIGESFVQLVSGPTTLAKCFNLSVKERLRVLILPAVLGQAVPGSDPTPPTWLEHRVDGSNLGAQVEAFSECGWSKYDESG